MTDRVFDQIGNHLGQQFGVPVDQDRRCIGTERRKHHACVLGHVLVDIDDIRQHGAKLDRTKPRQPRAGLDLGNAQQRGERIRNLVTFAQRQRQIFGNRQSLHAFARRRFKPVSQTVQRRAQIMRNIGTDLAHRLDNRGQPRQRAVDAGGNPVKVVALSAQRQPRGQIAKRHLMQCRVHLCQPVVNPRRQNRPRTHRRDQHQQRGPSQSPRKDLAQVVQIGVGQPDGQSISASGAGEDAIGIVRDDADPVRRDDRPTRHNRDVGDVRRHHPPGLVFQQIDRGAVRAGGDPVLDVFDQIALLACQHRLFQRHEYLGDPAILTRGQLGMHQAIANAARQQQRGKHERGHRYRQPERSAAQQVSEAHGLHTPHS